MTQHKNKPHQKKPNAEKGKQSRQILKLNKMKKGIITSIVLTVFLSSMQYANATVRRVGYFGNPIAGVDFQTLQLAHDASAAGDTLLIFPGNWNATYTKKLVTIGYGYFVSGSGNNPNLQTITNPLVITVTLTTGSDFSIFTGLDGLSINESSGVIINNIFISRCYISNLVFNNKTYTNWQVTQSYIAGFNGVSYGGLLYNLLVSNCLLSNCTFATNTAQTGLFMNNTFISSPNFGSGSFLLSNNIFVYGMINQLNGVFQNNMGNSDYGAFPAGNGNFSITGTNMNNTVFVGFPTQGAFSNDGRFVLKAGSPAIGAGIGGVDLGMFGSTNPYRLSGIPAIPSFYKLTAPSTSTSGNPYTITFSVNSNN